MIDQSLKVSELNQFIKDVINSGFPQPLWICGEIQGYDRNKDKNHIFFELVEKDPESHEVKARISVVIFAGRKPHIEQILKNSENAFTLKDDIEVRFLCKIDFYAPHGAVRLSIESIDPVHTLGKIAQERQRLIVLLKKNGTLDKNKQVDFPLVPLTIGLITSHDSAAYNDFCSELKKSGYAFKVFVRNTLMQGKKTEKEVCRAIDGLQKIGSIDVIVITRGGGSIAELSCFDNQKIAEAIASCPLPVLSGIGHEINTTITDLAAHTYAKTPTAIARFLVNRVEEYLNGLEEKVSRIIDFTQDYLSQKKQRVKNFAFDLNSNTLHFLMAHHQKMNRFQESLRQRPLVLLRQNQENLLQQRGALIKSIHTRFQQDKLKIKNMEKLVEMANPVNTMKRGFTITRNKNGKIIRKVEEVQLEDSLLTELANGIVYSHVKLIEKEKKHG